MSANEHVLLVEDDPSLGAAVRDALLDADYQVTWLRSGEAAAAAWHAGSGFGLVVLDLGLPGRDGLDVLASARRQGLLTPVLVLTARDDPQDRVRGLDAGADDYLIKPFHLAELLARVRARLRRVVGSGTEDALQPILSLTDDTRGAIYQGERVALTASEFAVLECLVRHAGQVVPRDRLEAALAGSARTPGSNTLDVYIHRLRRKIAADTIRTVHGIGYVLDTALVTAPGAPAPSTQGEH